MKAAVMTAPYTIGLQEVARPVPGPREVLIRMKTAGICGSDVHFYDGSHPYVQYPQIFGHELSGVIEEIGAEVTERSIGDRVVVEPAIPCGRCYPCRIGKPNCCVDIDMVGAWRAGGFAEYVAVPASSVHAIPASMNYDTGAICEPFSIAAQTADRAGVRSGSTVTILGMGPIGLATLIWLKRNHNVRVFAVDIVAERLHNASRFGADATINPAAVDLLENVAELTGGEGSNVVIESAGLKKTMEQSIHLVSPGGRIVIVGLTNDTVGFPGILFTKKEVEIFGSRNNAGQFSKVIDFLHRNPDVAERYISSRLPFDEIAGALRMAKSRSNEVNKIVLQFK